MFRKKGRQANVEELSNEHFTLRKTACHGFPTGPTALGYDHEHQLLSLGTKTGELRVYGRPGVEFVAQTESGSAIKQIHHICGNHQLLTLTEDNVIVMWYMQSEHDLVLVADPSHTFKLDPEGGKQITVSCLSQLSGHLYLGTESGNVFVLDIGSFKQDEENTIFWNNATAILQPGSKTHPGVVKSLHLCPTDPNKILIGYEKGVIVLWDLERRLPIQNYPANLQDCQQVQSVESLCWQADGLKFVTAHGDSGIYFWVAANSTPSEGPTYHYGNTCAAITKIKWLNSDSSPLLVFAGGVPVEQDGEDHHTVSVMQGADHVALDFTSPVVDFITVLDPGTQRGNSLLVLCEQELLAFDLDAPKCPQVRKPYLYTLHSTPVTCLKLYTGCPRTLYDDLVALSSNSSAPHDHFSQMEWPAMGGFVRACDPTAYDILVTGHENGVVRFWDVTTMAMKLIHELKTANLFIGCEPESFQDDTFSDFKWPPYRKVSTYDPFEDDPRLAIKNVELDVYDQTLCIGGNSGQVVVFSFRKESSDVHLQSSQAEIFAVFCMQCTPPTMITALALESTWGLVAAGNNKGFVVANFLCRGIILLHPTVQSDGVEARSLTRVQSFRRSLRSSFRRRSSTRSRDADDRRKIAASINVEMGVQPARSHQPGKRAASEPLTAVVNAEGEAVRPEQIGTVSNLVFAETYVTGGGTDASITASTMGSVIVRYGLSLPPPESRTTVLNQYFESKGYSLVHAAPVVGVFILDHEGVPLPTPSEVANRVVPEPDMQSPHYAVICTQEQIKLVVLPSMKQKRKEKVADSMGQRIIKAFLIRIKVANVPVTANRDWNAALLVLTNTGHLVAYALPDLRLVFEQEQFLESNNHMAIQSLTVSLYGEVLYLHSFSELERYIISSYGFSFHTTLLPNLFKFDGSTEQVQIVSRPATSSQRRQNSTTEGSFEASGGFLKSPGHKSGSIKQSPDHKLPTLKSPEHTSTPIKSVGERNDRSPSIDVSKADPVKHKSSISSANAPSKPKDQSTPIRSPPELSRSPPQPSPMVTGSTPSKTRDIEVSVAVSNGQVAQSPVPVATAQATGGMSLDASTMLDKDLIASASAFTKTAYSAKKERSGSVSSSSSESSSQNSASSEEGEATHQGEPIAFGNPLAFDVSGDFNESTKELDTIIASSLKQLESAKAFYQQMQARVKRDNT
ncbi:hypothetical protein EMCRGX_G027597 [Ephydatia muelleri]